MNVTRKFIVLAFAVSIIGAFYFIRPCFSEESIGQVELKKLNIEVSGAPDESKTQLPEKFTGPYEGVLASVCKEQGYDLSAYAGKEIIEERFRLKGAPDDFPVAVIVSSCDGKIICIHGIDPESAPGLLTVGELRDYLRIKPWESLHKDRNQ